MITKRNTLWLLPLLLILTFPLWKIPVASFLAPRGGFDPQFTKKKSARHNFVISGVTILQSEGETQTANIRATTARTSRRPHEYILDEVDADIINSQGSLTNVVAKTGNYNFHRKRLKLTKDVVVTNREQNYTMTTDLLYYDGNKLTVYCPGETHLKGDGINIDGSSLGYDINTGIYTVGGRVVCILQGYDDS